jgi:hypothetical protein
MKSRVWESAPRGWRCHKPCIVRQDAHNCENMTDFTFSWEYTASWYWWNQGFGRAHRGAGDVTSLVHQDAHNCENITVFTFSWITYQFIYILQVSSVSKMWTNAWAIHVWTMPRVRMAWDSLIARVFQVSLVSKKNYWYNNKTTRVCFCSLRNHTSVVYIYPMPQKLPKNNF